MGSIKTKYWIYTLQVVGWCLILGLSFYWSMSSSKSGEEGDINSFRVVMLIVTLIPLLLIYVINNLLFIPRFLFNNRRTAFLMANVVLVVVLLAISSQIDARLISELIGYIPTRPMRPKDDLTFLIRDSINYILMIGFVTALRLMDKLRKSEEALKAAEDARKAAEVARMEAELTNLRNQLNPHFLLNTLNNIYALTAIDTDKAQKSIKELSLLLRYVLYDNHTDKVLLTKEVEFLKNYIELMRIRLTSQVKLSVEYNLSESCATEIAPLIFISLIENAFKHGVSADAPSFIEIIITNDTERDEVRLSIRNSNNAKSDGDKSGKGIGLDQVRRRLELQYPNAYEWTINDSREVYESVLTLKCR